jgi:hypothetical protein
MKSYAVLNSDNRVINVISIDAEMVATGLWGDPHFVKETCKDTKAGIHYGPDGLPDGQPGLRKNYAGIGYTYDRELDAFIPPSPYPSWIVNPDTGLWEAPVPLPDQVDFYQWNERWLSWELGTRPVPFAQSPLNVYINK